MKTGIRIYLLLFGSLVLTALLLEIGGFFHPVIAASLEQNNAPQLVIKKTVVGERTISPNQKIQFTITITNTGATTATNVTVKDDFDEEVFSEIVLLPEDEMDVQNDGDIITWQLGTLGFGEKKTMTYDATAVGSFPEGLIQVTNEASVLANEELIGQSTVFLEVQLPQLTLTRKLERLKGEGKIAVNDTLIITLQYSNEGSADATNVVIEETIDDSAIRQVDNISDDGQYEGSKIRWNLGVLPPGMSGEVNYEVVLKSFIPKGTLDNLTVISGKGLQAMSVLEPVSVQNPELSIERRRDDLNGDPIEPGDRLQFTIHVQNNGNVAASDMIIQDIFDERVVAEVSNILQGGREANGGIEWILTEPLEPGEERNVSYKVRLITQVDEPTEASNVAVLLLGNKEVLRAQTSMIIEPLPTEGKEGVFLEPWMITALTGVMGVSALVVLILIAQKLIHKDKWQENNYGRLVQGVAIVLIIEAVLVLAIGPSGISEEGAVGILSGIAGYVLGRSNS